jgi:hypothetical protein
MVNRWDKVTLAQYVEMVESLGDMDDASEEDAEDITMVLISILLDKPLDDIRDMDYDDFVEVSNNLSFINTPIPTEYNTVLDIDGTELHLIPFNTLEFGAFIDIEHLLTENTSYINNLPKILSIFYRQSVTPATTLTKAVYETYDDWLDVRDTLMEKVSLTALYGVIGAYMNWRGDILKKYGGLFQEPEGSFDDEDEADYVKGMTSAERTAYEQEKNVSKWSWVLMMHRLASGDMTKIDEVAAFPILKALNLLSLMHELKIG